MIMELFQKNFYGSMWNKLKYLIIKRKLWRQFEYFDESWQKRVAKMSNYLKPGESVLDLGCGKMYLREYLNNNNYIPVDYTKRDKETIICDFNNKEFPSVKVDTCFISGCLEYIYDYKWFIEKVCNHSNKAILSYCTTNEFSDKLIRKQNGWINHLSAENINQLFENNSFHLKKTDYSHNRDQIFIFEKK